MKKIFIVDDDAFMLMMLEDHLLKNANFTVFTFSTGEACLEQLHLNPHVYIIDFHLDAEVEGAKDGIAIIKQIRKVYRRAPIILLTSSDFKRPDQGDFSSDNVSYLTKSTSAFQEINALLKELL